MYHRSNSEHFEWSQLLDADFWKELARSGWQSLFVGTTNLCGLDRSAILPSEHPFGYKLAFAPNLAVASAHSADHTRETVKYRFEFMELLTGPTVQQATF